MTAAVVYMLLVQSYESARSIGCDHTYQVAVVVVLAGLMESTTSQLLLYMAELGAGRNGSLCSWCASACIYMLDVDICTDPDAVDENGYSGL